MSKQFPKYAKVVIGGGGIVGCSLAYSRRIKELHRGLIAQADAEFYNARRGMSG